MAKMKSLAELLKRSSCRVEDGSLEVASSEVELLDIYRHFAELGYKGDYYVGSDQALSISLAVPNWSSTFIFKSNAELWQKVIQRRNLPERFYVIESHFHSEALEEHNILLMKFYIQWLSLLLKIKDHGGHIQDPVLVFFINTEKGAKKYEIDYRKVEFADLENLEVTPEDSADLKYLIELVSLQDAHQKERREVLRSSLAELLDGDNIDSPMLWLLQQGKRLKKKFQENHDVYLHKFSVNKLLSEIEEKSTDYISKINESISSSQSKAFAIPGALIAIAALIKNADFFSLLFVCAGLLSVTILTFVANKIHSESYDALKDQVTRSLTRYEVMKDEDAVRVSAAGAKKKLLKLIDRSKNRLALINYLSVTIFIMGVCYTIANTSVLGHLLK
jgi:hypothetical protein